MRAASPVTTLSDKQVAQCLTLFEAIKKKKGTDEAASAYVGIGKTTVDKLRNKGFATNKTARLILAKYKQL